MKKLIAALAFAAFATVAFAQTPATTTTQTTTTKTTKEKQVVAATPAPTAQEIANAKDKGLVWVNTSSKAYHYKEGKYYGKTKHGKFMTEDDAKAAGYTPVKAAVVKKSDAAK